MGIMGNARPELEGLGFRAIGTTIFGTAMGIHSSILTDHQQVTLSPKP